MAEFTALLSQLPEGDRIMVVKFCESLLEARQRQRRQRSEWLKRCPVKGLEAEL